MTRPEVKAELERIHGENCKPVDLLFERFTDMVWDTLDGDEEQVEAFRFDLANIGPELGVGGLQEALALFVRFVTRETLKAE